MCKFKGCNKKGSKTYGGYCQSCWRYFVKEGKTIYPKPKYGQVFYNEHNDVVCPLCGKAFRKLGSHFLNSHGITVKEAREQFGWYANTRLSNKEYIEHMRDVLQDHCVTDNLIIKGKSTRFKLGDTNTPKKDIPAPKIIKLKKEKWDGSKITFFNT